MLTVWNPWKDDALVCSRNSSSLWGLWDSGRVRPFSFFKAPNIFWTSPNILHTNIFRSFPIHVQVAWGLPPGWQGSLWRLLQWQLRRVRLAENILHFPIFPQVCFGEECGGVRLARRDTCHWVACWVFSGVIEDWWLCEVNTEHHHQSTHITLITNSPPPPGG